MLTTSAFLTLQPDLSAGATSAALSRAGSLPGVSTCHHQTPPDLVKAACTDMQISSRSGRSTQLPSLPQQRVSRHERPEASSAWRQGGFDSRLQGSGSESRITRCGCFRIARFQGPTGCDFPKLPTDTTQASACSFVAACKPSPARFNTPAQTKRAKLDPRR